MKHLRVVPSRNTEKTKKTLAIGDLVYCETLGSTFIYGFIEDDGSFYGSNRVIVILDPQGLGKYWNV